MKPPPDALGRVESASATAGAAKVRARAWRRQAKRAAARAYLAQCNACHAIGTVRLRPDGRLVSLGFPLVGRRHRGCEASGPALWSSDGISLFDLPPNHKESAA